MQAPEHRQAPLTGLILSGGGARAAYQAGVLSAIADLLNEPAQNPFQVIVGTSAGAINAVGLACGALDFAGAVRRLTSVWQQFHTDQVYRSDWPGVLRQAGRFIGCGLMGLGQQMPVALLDSSPLRVLLERELDFSGIAAAIRQRRLHAVAVSAFAYSSAQAVTFYQGRATIDPWFRHRRVGVPTRLEAQHLLASTAIPLIFSPVKIGRDYYGDGAVRQSAPISPALHLGARRVLVIGVSAQNPPSVERAPLLRPPSLAQIGGHLMNSTFIDSLESDLEMLMRLNQISHMMPPGQSRSSGRIDPVEVLVVAPSQPLDQIAARHLKELPASLRFFMRGSGATKAGGGGVLSYLLFESGYCQELIELGYRDAMQRREALCAFLSAPAGDAPAHSED